MLGGNLRQRSLLAKQFYDAKAFDLNNPTTTYQEVIYISTLQHEMILTLTILLIKCDISPPKCELILTLTILAILLIK